MIEIKTGHICLFCNLDTDKVTLNLTAFEKGWDCESDKIWDTNKMMKVASIMISEKEVKRIIDLITDNLKKEGYTNETMMTLDNNLRDRLREIKYGGVLL